MMQESDLEIVPGDARAVAVRRRRFVVRQAPQQHGRDHIADGIAQDRDRRAEHLHQQAADRRADDLRSRCGRFLLGVGVEQPAFLDQGRRVGEVRAVEHQAAGHDDEHHHQQLRQREAAEPGRERNGQQQPGADKIGRDQQRPPPHPVDQHARRQAEDQVRQRHREIEPGEIERPGAQQHDRAERNRLAPDPRPKRRRRLRAPQMQKPAMAPERSQAVPLRNRRPPPPSWGRVGVGVSSYQAKTESSGSSAH